MLVAAAGLCGCEASDGTGAAPASAPAAALSLEVTDTRGVLQWLAARRGAPVLVNFWATWCPPCVAELPDLLEGTRAFRARGGVVVGVALEQMGDAEITAEEAVERARAKAEELGLDFPVLVCTDDDMMVIRRVLGVELGGLPQTLAYDRAAQVVAHHEGVATAAQFASMASAAER